MHSGSGPTTTEDPEREPTHQTHDVDLVHGCFEAGVQAFVAKSEHKGKDRWPRERDGVAEGIVALIGWIAVGIRGLGDQTEKTRDPYREGREEHLPW